MADEVAKRRSGLRQGLPRLLAEGPAKLNDLLGLTRQERLRIGTLVPKTERARDAELKSRPEPVRPGERDRVVVQFHDQHPQVRQAACPGPRCRKRWPVAPRTPQETGAPTSISNRQWSLGPHSSTSLSARTRTSRWKPRDANT